ncbi:hypothetical protein B296_00037658 [Ensete ventricosum]|uniref:Uncharacterized protein n=1 Tax=Ensete ventricosum TaxID=4639 RepID=A0A426ZYW2_ENSVE|nr:hypothetical protein B296_00037658 [Ensete ventricosum]
MKYDHVLKWLMQARLLERTPSMSDLNEVVFGQEHLSRNDLAFVFCLKLKFFDKVNTRLAAAEEALALSIWTTSTICHALSLETGNINKLSAGRPLSHSVVHHTHDSSIPVA